MAHLAQIDMHTHTTASDGVHSPIEIVRKAKEVGLAGVAITDHDTVAGIAEALEEGRRIGMMVVPGVEISTVAQGIDIHVLGYGMNWQDADFLHRLTKLRDTRDLRNEMMIGKLVELGIAITMEQVVSGVEARSKDETIGRPHIAQALIKIGVVSSVSEAFDRYLGSRGAAYVNPPRIRSAEAVLWIREAGGKAVLAHPGLYGNDELVRSIVLAGIDGIEARHSDHAPEQERMYEQLGMEHGLIITAGSDYHGIREGEQHHGGIGSRSADLAVLEQIL